MLDALRLLGARPTGKRRGSHEVWERRESDRLHQFSVSRPHGEQVVPRGTLYWILRWAGLTPEQFWNAYSGALEAQLEAAPERGQVTLEAQNDRAP